jgi:hypothetical protein
MTPRGKKVLIISISLLAIGGVVGYIFWKKAKDKKDAQIKADADAKAVADANASQGGGSKESKPKDEKPKDSKPKDEKPKDEKPIVNTSGFVAGEELVPIFSMETTNGAKVMSATAGGNYGKTFLIKNAKYTRDMAGGNVQLVARLKNEKTGAYGNETVFGKAYLWKKKPVVAVAPASTYGGTGW